MTIKAVVMIAAMLSGAPALAADMASAVLIRGDGTDVGTATFEAKPDGIALTVSATGLKLGAHGLHLHAVGRCTGPDFASAGGHWNPSQRKHGLHAPDGAHLGDLPNLEVGADGKGTLTTLVKGATLDSGANGLFDADGTAIVIHAGPDDNMTDPSGNSGGREYCGVVTAR